MWLKIKTKVEDVIYQDRSGHDRDVSADLGTTDGPRVNVLEKSTKRRKDVLDGLMTNVMVKSIIALLLLASFKELNSSSADIG